MVICDDRYRIERVVLYGSRARGDLKPDSDYDIGVFGRGYSSFYDGSGRLAAITTDTLEDKGPSVPQHRFRPGPIASAPVHARVA